jgi:hypothetical protein
MQSRPRQGFTLVEMMVVVALTMFIMLILSTAFSTALETFRQLKAIGDMQDQLRTATNMLRTDLSADHFEGKRRLSDPNFWTLGPPREGFFRLTQVPNTQGYDAPEGVDADGIVSRRRVGHILHFTVKRRGRNPSDFFSATIPTVPSPNNPLALLPNPDGRFQDPGSIVFNSQWVEVIYFLYPNGLTANGTPLYGLYRQQRVVVPDPSLLNTTNTTVSGTPMSITTWSGPQLTSYLNAYSCFPINGNFSLYFNSPSSLTIPERRFGMQLVSGKPAYNTNLLVPRSNGNGNATGDDLVMTNVVSFDVQVLPPSTPSTYAQVLNPVNPQSPALFDLSVPSGYGAVTTPPQPFFDTWSFVQDELGANYSDQSLIPKYGGPAPPPTTITIQGLQITLRVWDARTQQTRQVTIFQEM